MHPDVFLRVSNDPLWKSILVPLGTTFFGASLGALFAFWASMKIKRRDEDGKNHAAAQWSLFCLVHQWQFLKRIQEFILDREEEIVNGSEEEINGITYVTRGIAPDDAYLFIKQMKFDGYKLLDLKLDNMAHFALNGDPGLMVEMTKCQESVQDVINRMKDRENVKASIDEILNSSRYHEMIFDPKIESSDLIRKILNNQQLDAELRSYTDRTKMLLEGGIRYHIELITRMHVALHKLYPDVTFVGVADPSARLTVKLQKE